MTLDETPTKAQKTFDRIYAGYDGLPGFKRTRETTVRQAIPIVGIVTTFVIQTMKTNDAGFTIFLEVMDAEGKDRLVLPGKVAEAIYRQRQSLTDRSTPASRAAKARKRQRDREKRERTARRKAWAERNGT